MHDQTKSTDRLPNVRSKCVYGNRNYQLPNLCWSCQRGSVCVFFFYSIYHPFIKTVFKTCHSPTYTIQKVLLQLELSFCLYLFTFLTPLCVQKHLLASPVYNAPRHNVMQFSGKCWSFKLLDGNGILRVNFTLNLRICILCLQLENSFCHKLRLSVFHPLKRPVPTAPPHPPHSLKTSDLDGSGHPSITSQRRNHGHWYATLTSLRSSGKPTHKYVFGGRIRSSEVSWWCWVMTPGSESVFILNVSNVASRCMWTCQMFPRLTLKTVFCFLCVVLFPENPF